MGGRIDRDRTDRILHIFGDVCSSQGRFDEAEKMYLRALQGYEKAWGPDYTSTLDTVNNLGVLYADLERLEEAEKMYLRALQGYEKTLGQEAVKTYVPALNAAENMAALFQQTRRTQEADGLYKQALFGVEIVFGRTSDRYHGITGSLDTLRRSSEHDI
jgi:tetratricopeptide (TPR) repeat protein